jgi:hypothetical protein
MADITLSDLTDPHLVARMLQGNSQPSNVMPMPTTLEEMSQYIRNGGRYWAAPQPPMPTTPEEALAYAAARQ